MSPEPAPDAVHDAILQTVAAAAEVGRALQHDAERPPAPAKADESPVTVADFAIQAMLAHTLREAFGDRFALVAEESSEPLRRSDHAHVREAVVRAVQGWRDDLSESDVLSAIDAGAEAPGDRYWTIDPIDGTKGFVHGKQYAICIACIEHGAVTFGALGCPNLPADPTAPLDPHPARGTLFVAERGRGAWQRSETAPLEEGRALNRGGGTDRPPVLVASYHASAAGGELLDRMLESLGDEARRQRVDSQVKYALVARSQVDAYVRWPRPSIGAEYVWDHAPGVLIAAESGATVTDLDGRPLDFGFGARMEANRGIVSAVDHLHEQLLSTIAGLPVP